AESTRMRARGDTRLLYPIIVAGLLGVQFETSFHSRWATAQPPHAACRNNCGSIHWVTIQETNMRNEKTLPRLLLISAILAMLLMALMFDFIVMTMQVRNSQGAGLEPVLVILFS